MLKVKLNVSVRVMRLIICYAVGSFFKIRNDSGDA